MLTYMHYLKFDPRFGADMATRINAVINRERRSATHEAQTRWATQNPRPRRGGHRRCDTMTRRGRFCG